MDKRSTEFQRLSVAISWLRFPLIMCVIMLHCYCTVPLPPGDHSLFFGLVYFWGLWLGESGVPAFFFISGFLFYVSHKSYKERMGSRVHTLLYPYLLWNSIILVVYLGLYMLGHPLDIVGKNIRDYGFVDYIRAYIDRGDFADGNNGPVLCTYWYVRNLFLLCLVSPLWYYLNKRLFALFPALLCVWWISLHHNALLAESVFFFNLGACFAIHDVNPLELVCRKKPLFLGIWLFFAASDIVTHVMLPFEGAFYFHRISLILNIFAFILFADGIVNGDKEKVNGLLAGSVFWVFATHDHLAIALRRLCVAYWGDAPDLIQFLLYCVTVVVVTFICLVSYAVMSYLFPAFVKFATGNRTK